MAAQCCKDALNACASFITSPINDLASFAQCKDNISTQIRRVASIACKVFGVLGLFYGLPALRAGYTIYKLASLAAFHDLTVYGNNISPSNRRSGWGLGNLLEKVSIFWSIPAQGFRGTILASPITMLGSMS